MTEQQTFIIVDYETTGLKPVSDHLVLELGMIAVSSTNFEIVDEFSTLIKHSLDQILTRSSEHVIKMHEASGLLDLFRTNEFIPTLEQAENDAIKFYDSHCKTKSEMFGSNVDFDRGYMQHHMPSLHDKFHYRNCDVNSLFVLNKYITGEEKSGQVHRALEDCRQVVQALKKFRLKLLK